MNKLNINSQTLLKASEQKFADKDYLGAAEALQQGVQNEPQNAVLWSNLGYTYYLLGQLDAGENACRRAIDLDKSLIAAYSNLSMVLLAKEQYEGTLSLLDSAIELDASTSDLWINRGLLNLKINRINDAMTDFDRAISIQPLSNIAYTNLALCWQEIGCVEKAYLTYQKALKIDPNYAPTISNSLMCAQYHPALASAQILESAISTTSNLLAKPINKPLSTNKQFHSNKKRRIGFCSADFRVHPVGWFLRDVFTTLGNEFDCYCYANQTEKLDAISQEFQNSAASWFNSKGMNTDQLVHQVEVDNIDLLIDLSGHTAGNRLDLFTRTTKAKKISWLGFPASTALPTIDGVLLGEDLVTEATQAYFSEPIISIAGPQFVYRPPDYLPNITSTPCLENKHITFGCFNNLAKINDAVLSCWAELLKTLPDSRLVLKWKTLADSSAAERLLKRFHSLGIAASRIELRGASSHEEMLRQYNDIDIALDPFPFSGALTSFEAIWMGVPVVTMFTLRPISRQTFSINKALGLSSLNAQTPSSYIASAVDLVQNQKELIKLKISLRHRIKESALYDINAMSKNIAKAIHALL